MNSKRKEEAIKLVKEWQEKRPNFSRTRLSQATGVPYSTLIELDKEGLIKLPEKRPTSNSSTSWNNGRGMKSWLTK